MCPRGKVHDCIYPRKRSRPIRLGACIANLNNFLDTIRRSTGLPATCTHNNPEAQENGTKLRTNKSIGPCYQISHLFIRMNN
jgi:hypothetical protein